MPAPGGLGAQWLPPAAGLGKKRGMATATPSLSVLDLALPAPSDTEALGRALARLLRPGDVIALRGDLGAGKTALARALIRALPGPPDAEAEEVPSPTFTLVQSYPRRPAEVWHFDLYRIEHQDEVYELGLEEALAEGITLIEWPERMEALLPEDRLDITLTYQQAKDATSGGEAAPSGRLARLQGGGDWPQRLGELRP